MSSSSYASLPPVGRGGRLRVAALQMNSRDDKAANVETALRLVDPAAAAGARLVALPEVWTYLGPEGENRANAEPISGPTIDRLAERARRHGIYVHAGSILEVEPGDPRLLTQPSSSTPTARSSAATARSTCSTWCWMGWRRTRSRRPSRPVTS
jgi:predicted amidohydrolase